MKIAVLGIGESINLFSPERYDITFGVNDIAQYHAVDNLVIVDKITAFSSERICFMQKAKYKNIYSIDTQYAAKLKYDKFTRIKATYVKDYDKEQAICSITSAFPCTHIALKQCKENDEVHLYGVDIVTHWNFGKSESKMNRIKKDFTDLFNHYRKKGISIKVYGDGLLVNC